MRFTSIPNRSTTPSTDDPRRHVVVKEQRGTIGAVVLEYTRAHRPGDWSRKASLGPQTSHRGRDGPVLPLGAIIGHLTLPPVAIEMDDMEEPPAVQIPVRNRLAERKRTLCVFTSSVAGVRF